MLVDYFAVHFISFFFSSKKKSWLLVLKFLGSSADVKGLGTTDSRRGNSVRNFIRKITKCDKLTRKAGSYINQDEDKEKYEKTELKFLHSSNNTLFKKILTEISSFHFFQEWDGEIQFSMFFSFRFFENFLTMVFFFLPFFLIGPQYSQYLRWRFAVSSRALILTRIIFPDYWIYQIVKR